MANHRLWSSGEGAAFDESENNSSHPAPLTPGKNVVLETGLLCRYNAHMTAT